MNIERVKVLVTLQCENNVWEEGTILTNPLPPDILEEIRLERGTVEVLEYAKASESSIGQGSVISIPSRKKLLRKR